MINFSGYCLKGAQSLLLLDCSLMINSLLDCSLMINSSGYCFKGAQSLLFKIVNKNVTATVASCLLP